MRTHTHTYICIYLSVSSIYIESPAHADAARGTRREPMAQTGVYIDLSRSLSIYLYMYVCIYI